MNKDKTKIPFSGGVCRSKSLTPAVLGVPSCHGLKLPTYMTSEAKQKLSAILEERRKARIEKLASSILAKGKQTEKLKAPIPVPSVKPGTSGLLTSSKSQEEMSVFERLHKSGGKTKKPEQTITLSKPSLIPKTNSKRLTNIPLKKSSEVLPTVKEKTETFSKSVESTNKFNKTVVEFVEAQTKDCESDAVDKTHENEKQIIDDYTGICKENFSEAIADKNSDSEQSKIKEDNSTEMCGESSKETFVIKKPVSELPPNQLTYKHTKPVKSLSAFKSLPSKAAIKVGEAGKRGIPLRRSISMMFRKKQKSDFVIRRSVSAKNLCEMGLNLQRNDHTLPDQPKMAQVCDKKLKNEMNAKTVSFLTPKNNKLLTLSHLRNKLEDWLKINGHSLDGYRHLRCFGIDHIEKRFPGMVPSNCSLENSYYATAPNTPMNDSDKENVTPPTVLQQVDVQEAENWLKELHRLIVELKYPSERCEEWLAAIRKKCSSCTQLPIYWECLAAVHESKGDVKSAIEDYERAIIKGGEVDAVGNSLAQLFDKMVIEQKKNSKHKLEKGLDPKNIFKSTIIKFALQQKALKKLSSQIEPGVRQQLYIATPVRRSTRIQTPFKSTDEVASLQTLKPELLKSVTFKPNRSLLRGD